MSSDPAGSAPTPPARAWRDAYDLLASMRFAIALLTVICIASVIGTVVKQNEPFNSYVNQFGPFWAEVFAAVGLYTVYSTGWFLLILAFLVVSTSLCIVRNTPKILADLRSFKEGLREQSLQSFHHKAHGTLAAPPQAVLAQVSALLAAQGWQARAQPRPHGTMVAARKGMANKLGYLAAHSAIVLICLGGLLDGDLIVRAQMALAGKSVYGGGGMIKDVPAAHRLGAANPTFRGNLVVPEGARAGVAVLNMPAGVVLQELPFDIELKKFTVDYYDSGMPKLFASEIVIHDHETGQATAATVKVNEPARHRGIMIYQSSFDDGGSRLKLRAHPLHDGGAAREIDGVVGASTALAQGPQPLTLELTGLRVINVESIGSSGDGGGDAASAPAAAAAGFGGALDKHLGSGAKGDARKLLRNIGPSFSYKLRDASGQAREFSNYMLPVEMDGQRVLLAGVRDTPAEDFRYLRIPVDDHDSAQGWLRLRAALLQPSLRDEAARRYAALATPPDRPELREQLFASAQRTLALFAGPARPPAPGAAADAPQAGLNALASFIDANVPEAERARMSEVLLRILNSSLFELANLARAQAGQAPLPQDAATDRFMRQAVLSLSDAAYYPAPFWLELTEYTQVQASVFQLARAPGKALVYLGAVLLVVGVFAMLYIRERRLWIWLQPDPAGGTQLSAALSTTRRTLDADTEFEALRARLLKDPQ